MRHFMKTRMYKEFLQNYKFEEVEKSYEEFIGINDYFDKEKTYQEILEKLKHKNIGIIDSKDEHLIKQKIEQFI